MLTQKLEAKIIEAVKAKLGETAAQLQFVGTWQPSESGLHNMGDPAYFGTIAVSIGLPTRPTYTSPEATFNGAIEIDIRYDRDVTGALTLAVGEAIEALMLEWQGETYQKAFTALNIDGLELSEVNITGSAVPVINRQSALTRVNITFALTGHTTK